MKLRYLGQSYLLAAMLFLVPILTFGQTTARITGRITDSNGASVPDATVTVANPSTGLTRPVQTDQDGYYTVTELTPGVYEMTVSKNGFQTTTQPNITLNVAQVARLDTTLQVGKVSENVVVTGHAPLLNAESPTVGEVIDHTSVVELPLNGRNFLQLTTLTPGAVSGGSGFYLANNSVRLNGMNASNTIYMIDGVMTTDQTFSGVTITPPPDAIQEFNVQSNTLSAEYGLGGAVVNVELRSGTNQFHGSAWEFLRNDALDARNYFATTQPELRQNQFGFTLGGPIKRNRTFFFGDYQGTRIRRGITSNSVVPTAAERKGDFSKDASIIDPTTGQPFQGNIIQPGRVSQQAAFFLPFISLPNTPAGTFSQSLSSQDDTNQFDIRGDHQIRASDSLTGSYSFQHEPIIAPGAFPKNGGVTTEVKDQRAGPRWTHIFSPNMINVLGAGYTRTIYSGTQQGAGTNYTEESGIGGFDTTSQLYPGFPNLSINGYQGINGNTSVPITIRENTWLMRDNLTFIKGRHTFLFGAHARWYAADSTNGATSRGSFSFTGAYTGNSFADYLLGIPFTGQRTFPRSLFGNSENQQELYASDEWKATPNLTLTLGAHYYLLHPSTFLHDQGATLDPATNRLIVSSNDKGQINLNAALVTPFVYPLFADIIVPSATAGVPSSLREINKHDLAPILGLAWAPASDVVVRLGYGIVYSLEEGNRTLSEAHKTPPFTADELSQFNPNGTSTLADFFPEPTEGHLNLGPLSFFNLALRRPDPYFQQWNVTFQKLVHKELSLELAYVGNKGTHLPFSLPSNVPDPGPGTIQNRRLNTRFGVGAYIENTDNNIYHSLQTKLETRSWRGLNLLATYTWAKGIDGQGQGASESETSPVQDYRNPQAERSVSPLDLTNRFTMSAVYDLPFMNGKSGYLAKTVSGWRVTSIVTLQSGFPFTPTIGTDPANTGTSIRPNRIGSGVVKNRTITKAFDVSAFQVPAAYTFGNSGNYILRGFPTKNWDFGLFREFTLNRFEGVHLEFRSEFFNFTNTPPFGASSPIANIQSSAAGQVLTAGNPREIQFALKLSF